MLRCAALALCAVVLSLPCPAAAQKATPKQASAVPTDANALALWCRQQIFRKYAHPVPGKAGFVQLEINQSYQLTDSCIRSRGQSF